MGSSALVALGLLLALQFLIQNEGVESKKHWPNGAGSKVMQRGWGGGLMQKVLYRQDKLRHWLQELQGVTNYQEETDLRFDEELNTILSELRKRKLHTNDKLNTIQSNIQSQLRKLKRRVKKIEGGCDDGEVPTTDLHSGELGCCKPGFSLAQGKCCLPNYLADEIINSNPIGSGITVTTNCCGVNTVETNNLRAVDGQCCEPGKLSIANGDDLSVGALKAAKCCAATDLSLLTSDFECAPQED